MRVYIHRVDAGGTDLDYTKILFLALAVALLLYLFEKIRSVRRRLTAVARVVDSCEVIAEHPAPRSVSGMTKLLLPRILEDFPEFSYESYRLRCENLLHSYFEALSTGEVRRLTERSEVLEEQVRRKIEALSEEGCSDFREVTIHQTELSDYQNGTATCRIIFQSAVGYRCIKEDGSYRQIETRYEVELLYVQDAAAADYPYDGGYSLHCPNCGAPVTNLGEKQCAYCGTAIVVSDQRVWSFDRIAEVD